MPAIMVTNHKGGVGKTFLTVHLAHCLDKRRLVVDCDGQYDAYRFLTGAKPISEEEESLAKSCGPQLSVLPNQRCRALGALRLSGEMFDYFLFDCDARLADAAKNIVQNPIDLVIAPVNDQSLSINNLPDLVDTVGKLFGTGRPVSDRRRPVTQHVAGRLLIVPLGADEQALTAMRKKLRILTTVKTAKTMPWMRNETDESLKQRTLLWKLDSLTDEKKAAVKAYFDDLAATVKQMCRQAERK